MRKFIAGYMEQDKTFQEIKTYKEKKNDLMAEVIEDKFEDLEERLNNLSKNSSKASKQ
tara:strand:+ start:694 stop:867 length:174 start_codon:yes stop_codon:yes gene_type:complete